MTEIKGAQLHIAVWGGEPLDCCHVTVLTEENIQEEGPQLG